MNIISLICRLQKLSSVDNNILKLLSPSFFKNISENKSHSLTYLKLKLGLFQYIMWGSLFSLKLVKHLYVGY